MAISKKQKVAAARKNAEALKAKKKAARGTSSVSSAPKGKGKSLIAQAKPKKK